MPFEIRLEEDRDHDKVAHVTREAFWNLYAPGADEHLVIHKLRKSPGFLPNLCFVAVQGGEVVGCIFYSVSIVKDSNDVDHEMITIGPVSVLPSLQSQGIGSALIRHSLKEAADMGKRAVVLYGEPAYYARFGFVNGKMFGISAPDGEFMKALLVKELYPGALNGISGRFYEDSAFHIDESEKELFDRDFPVKEKFVTASQERFQKMVVLKFDDPDLPPEK